ncbi:MAG: hypothetical protein AAFX99_18555 [Myxococcota bacterium]
MSHHQEVKNAWIFLSFFLIFALIDTGCTPWLRLPASGRVAGEPISTTVDSPWARYYLETYSNDNVAAEARDPSLDRAMDDLLEEYAQHELDRSSLQSLSQRTSTDFATLVLAQALYSKPHNAHINHQYRAHFRALRHEMAHGQVPVGEPFPYTVVFVPGWFYRRAPENGGDFAASRAVLTAMGIDHTLIALEENASVEANAHVVLQVLTALARQGQRVVVVSASKSGPEVAIALSAMRGEPSRRFVAGWLNIGGVLRGSPAIDEVLDSTWTCAAIRVRLWFWGEDLEGAKSLRTKRRRLAYGALKLPEHMAVLHFVPWPLSGDITERADGLYQNLRNHGPNDGVTLLIDSFDEAYGATLIGVGLDHFLQKGDTRTRTVALLRTLRDLIATQAHGIAHGPNHPP